jgi:hypothetical protein
LRWGVVSPRATPQAGGPSLVISQRLLIQYIHSYPPYPEAFSSILLLLVIGSKKVKVLPIKTSMKTRKVLKGY